MKRTLLLLFTLMLSSINSYSQTTNWIGASDTDWNNALNWDAGVPVAGSTIVILKNKPNYPIINESSILNAYLKISINAGATLTLDTDGSAGVYTLHSDENIAVTGTVNINYSSATLETNNRVRIGGNLTNNGTINCLVSGNVLSGGTLTNNATVVCKNGTALKNLQVLGTLASGDGATYDSNVEIISPTAAVIPAGSTVTVIGSMTVGGTAAGTLTIDGTLLQSSYAKNKASGTVNINGTYDLGAGTKNFDNYSTTNFGAGSTITYGYFNNYEGGNMVFSTSGTSTLEGKLILKYENTLIPAQSDVIIDKISLNAGDLTIPPSLTIEAGGKLTVTGNVDNKTIYNKNGTITIKSTGLSATQTGSMITNGTDAASISGGGSYAVERVIDNSENKWQLISSPVNGEKSSIFEGHNLNYFDEKYGNFKGITALTRALYIGEGFVVRYSAGTGGVPASDKIVYGKAFNFGDKTRDLIHTKDQSGGHCNTFFDLPVGFNLVGNPFPSNLNWDDVYGAGTNGALVDATLYYYVGDGNGSNPAKPVTNGWKTYTSGAGVTSHENIISIAQGFGVIVSGNDPALKGTVAGTLSIPNSATTHAVSDGFNKKSSIVPNSFRLVAVSNNVTDNIRFRENNSATENFDSRYDAYKLNSFGYSPTPSFVSADGKKLDLCQTPHVESIDMGFTMESEGEVVFSLEDVYDFTEIILEDTKQNTFTNLMKDNYTFQYSSDDEEFGRFKLHFNKSSLSEDQKLISFNLYTYDNTLYLKSAKELTNAQVSIFSTNGEKVFARNFATLRDKQITTPLTKGIYIVTIKSEQGIYTQKVTF